MLYAKYIENAQEMLTTITILYYDLLRSLATIYFSIFSYLSHTNTYPSGLSTLEFYISEVRHHSDVGPFVGHHVE